ncbi:putative protein with domain present in ubiquitin-regulatory proteins [Lyophyllum shimeji]|uniref:UBX domain-containing protein n=1 Tax=Lyophyllum shimeji TaxID=47721 RepID=A0A9P3PDU2_LYOSH|nr:putative protein with domain present in ubiquitin-regulatory proteins [Lyophyllum shimeji]
MAIRSIPKGPPASGPGALDLYIRFLCESFIQLLPFDLFTLVESVDATDTTGSSKPEIVDVVRDQPAFKVYKPSSVASAAPPPPLPDDYFEPTAADLKAAQATLAARTQALVNAPLELRAVREAREQKKRERWPNTTIRIRFTDRTQLERTFPSTDKIRSVYAFVRDSLRDDVKPIKFILYQPPKRELKVSDPQVRDLTLGELQLAPSSVLLLKFVDESLNGSDVPAPLLPSILSQAVDLPARPDYDATPANRSETSTSIPSSSPAPTGGEKKIPKWFKLGIKK